MKRNKKNDIYEKKVEWDVDEKSLQLLISSYSILSYMILLFSTTDQITLNLGLKLIILPGILIGAIAPLIFILSLFNVIISRRVYWSRVQ